ncbi:MAG: hypothetical protein R3F38_14620 [Gammaproteobacteria bacterium]
MPSLLRGFSAPAKLDYPYSREELAFLMSQRQRWIQSLGRRTTIVGADPGDGIAAFNAGKPIEADLLLLGALRRSAGRYLLDQAMVARMFELPPEPHSAGNPAAADRRGWHSPCPRTFQAAAWLAGR